MIQIYRSLQTCFYTCSRCRRAASAPEEVRGARTWHIETRSILGNGKSLLGLVCAAGVPASDRHERPTPSTLRAAIRVRHVACRKAVRRVLRNNCHPFLSPIVPLIRRRERILPLPPTAHGRDELAALPSHYLRHRWVQGGSVVGCEAEMLSSTRTPG